MDQKRKYKIVFEGAKKFLDISGVLNFSHETDFQSMVDANERLIKSLSNRDRMANVIAFGRRREALKKVLFDFDPQKISAKYSTADELLEVFKRTFHLSTVDGPRSLWRLFAKGVVAGSAFLASFKDKDGFNSFVKLFDYNKYTSAALPMLLSKELKGFGFALACDFLKELGYRCYPKPDRHLIDIFFSLGLCPSREPYDVYKTIIEMTEVVEEDAYNVDKIFWMIGRRRAKDVFIKEMQKALEKLSA